MESTHSESEGFRTPEHWNSVPVPERVAERAYEHVDVNEDGCWISRYSVASHGYAQIGWWIPERQRRTRARTAMVLAHRAAWVHVNGQLPIGMTLDHVCKTRRCVNPGHLRLLPNYENARRNNGLDWPMGQCANGHSNSLRVPYRGRDKQGAPRESTICNACRKLYVARNNWRTRHPGKPMPDRLLLASERTEK